MPRENRNELTDIAGELVAPFETEKAYRFFDGSRTEWISKSQCEWDEEESVMTMPLWLAIEKGFV